MEKTTVTGRKTKIQKAYQIQDDDQEIVSHVCRHRAIDSDMLADLFPDRSREHIKRRLKFLRLDNLIDAPPQQQEIHNRVLGSRPRIYAPTNKGARQHRARTKEPIATTGWAQKNREIKWSNIDHTLSTTRFMVELERSLAPTDMQLITLPQIIDRYAPPRTKKAKHPAQFRTPISFHNQRGKEGIEPDRIFGICGPKGTDFFFLEIDEGTETIEPSLSRQRSDTFFRRSSILRKLVLYASAFRHHIHQERFGIPNFRVIFVPPTPARAANMIETAKRTVCTGEDRIRPGLFFFPDRETIDAHAGNLLSTPFPNEVGKQSALISEPSPTTR